MVDKQENGSNIQVEEKEGQWGRQTVSPLHQHTWMVIPACAHPPCARRHSSFNYFSNYFSQQFASFMINSIKDLGGINKTHENWSVLIFILLTLNTQVTQHIAMVTLKAKLITWRINDFNIKQYSLQRLEGYRPVVVQRHVCQDAREAESRREMLTLANLRCSAVIWSKPLAFHLRQHDSFRWCLLWCRLKMCWNYWVLSPPSRTQSYDYRAACSS